MLGGGGCGGAQSPHSRCVGDRGGPALPASCRRCRPWASIRPAGHAARTVRHPSCCLHFACLQQAESPGASASGLLWRTYWRLYRWRIAGQLAWNVGEIGARWGCWLGWRGLAAGAAARPAGGGCTCRRLAPPLLPLHTPTGGLPGCLRHTAVPQGGRAAGAAPAAELADGVGGHRRRPSGTSPPGCCRPVLCSADVSAVRPFARSGLVCTACTACAACPLTKPPCPPPRPPSAALAGLPSVARVDVGGHPGPVCLHLRHRAPPALLVRWL